VLDKGVVYLTKRGGEDLDKMWGVLDKGRVYLTRGNDNPVFPKQVCWSFLRCGLSHFPCYGFLQFVCFGFPRRGFSPGPHDRSMDRSGVNSDRARIRLRGPMPCRARIKLRRPI
jgi:hypothetical protein